jgi:hypothetical protein
MHIDFFDFFRYALATVVTIYATVVTLQSLWSWYVILTGEGKYYAMIRRYLMLQGLRLRIQTFGADVLICVLLTVVLCILWHAHQVVAQIDTSPDSHAGRIVKSR